MKTKCHTTRAHPRHWRRVAVDKETAYLQPVRRHTQIRPIKKKTIKEMNSRIGKMQT